MKLRTISTDKKSGHKPIVIAACITITLIVLINTICTLVICCPELFGVKMVSNIDSMTQTEKVESTLLSSGLSILGIVMAVWTGISIINAIDINRINTLDDNVDNLEKRTHSIEDMREQQNEMDKEKFICEMLLTSKDIATKELIKMFENAVSTLDVPYMKFLEIEHLFRTVVKLHNNPECESHLRDNAVKGINIAEGLLQKIRGFKQIDSNYTIDNVFSVYLAMRIAEFRFYMGYVSEGKECIEHFLAALETYNSFAKIFGASVPEFEYNAQFPDISYETCTGSPSVSAYFCNSIGESYSRIVKASVQDGKVGELSEPMTQEYAKKAVFYCAYAVHWDNREIYWRNLGCAIERFPLSEESFRLIVNVYNNAIEAGVCHKTFKVMLSILDKYINKHLSILPVENGQHRQIPLSEDVYYDTWTRLLKEPAGESLLWALSELRENSRIAKTLYPTEDVGYFYACVYHRDMCIVNDGNVEQAKQHLLEAFENYKLFKLIASTERLSRFMKEDLLALSKRLNLEIDKTEKEKILVASK